MGQKRVVNKSGVSRIGFDYVIVFLNRNLQIISQTFSSPFTWIHETKIFQSLTFSQYIELILRLIPEGRGESVIFFEVIRNRPLLSTLCSQNILPCSVCLGLASLKFKILIYCGNLKFGVYKIMVGETLGTTFAVCLLFILVLNVVEVDRHMWSSVCVQAPCCVWLSSFHRPQHSLGLMDPTPAKLYGHHGVFSLLRQEIKLADDTWL